MFDALRFVPLIGCYVRAERPATDEETQTYGTDVMGGEGTVIDVHDVNPGRVVLGLGEGNSPIVVGADEYWTWQVWARSPRQVARGR